MRFIQSLVLVMIIALAVFYFMEQTDMSEDKAMENTVDFVKEKRSVLDTKVVPEELFRENIFRWISQTENELLEQFGEPLRKDPSAYGYEWWVYKKANSEYVQFGVLDKEIVSIYATGDHLELDPIYIGQAYEELQNEFNFSDEITYSETLSSYTFRLTEEDVKIRPLVKVSNEVFMQLYFDSFTEELSSVRILTADTLLKHRPYEIVYRGELPGEPNMSEEEWKAVEKGMEKQIYDITNVMRERQGKKALEWEDTVSEVAYEHSKDMAENDYFSHFGLDGEGLKERLAAKEVFYVSAGENIAAQYTDAPAAMEGWLNSEGHREALFNDEYTHIGVGVYRLHYTQNFLAQAL
ncbi:CAP domain-containing protein [Oceanobacillus salinisoli]|uniref:CAP domain-containing protein n=1 Tax=Oceanobacillus salinisoli TaxID=2678611 RepID=UPI0012E247CE|nr:CAP domain-containing protein [Oceanobacillus salinisoli]